MAWKVTTFFHDDGRVEASIEELPEKLDNRTTITEVYEECIDYFDSEKEARDYYNNVLAENGYFFK